jgi:hypothetical protein
MRHLAWILMLAAVGCTQAPESAEQFEISRSDYHQRLQGFWLGQSIANWTGLITEMDKIGGDGWDGKGAGFYTRANWGGPDEPNIWGGWGPGTEGDSIDFFLDPPNETWGADDDTDIEYIYLRTTFEEDATRLSAEQIRRAWLKHIYSDENTPFKTADGHPENYLWVSNQTAHDLMRGGVLPPETSDPARNPHYEMIDAQLTTEIFGLFAPGRPSAALDLAYLPIRTTARGDAAAIAEFYVVMYSLASKVNPDWGTGRQLNWMAERAQARFEDGSYSAAMYDFVKTMHASGAPWEATRDSLQERYQIRMEDGYDWAARDEVCGGCFAAGINFAAGMVSLFYGEGDLLETIRIGSLAGWDSDNPTATWGGLIGFLVGKEGVEKAFGRRLAGGFDIHRTRGGFDSGIDTFDNMASMGVTVVDRVVERQLGGSVDADRDVWVIPRR